MQIFLVYICMVNTKIIHMSIERVKSLLPDGSYKAIADATGRKRNTIALFFVGKARVSEETRKAILRAAAERLKRKGGEMVSVGQEILQSLS